MGARAILAEAMAPLVDLVYPPRCPLCGDGIAQQRGLCTPCWSELVIPGQPACASCQRPFGADTMLENGAVCAPCLQSPPVHDGIAAGTLYNDASRALVLRFKHGGRIALAPMLAGLILSRLPAEAGDALLVPVPLHRWRLWRRGYNQSALLAKELARRRGFQMCLDALVRSKHTPPLGGMGRKARARILSGAIHVREKHRPLVKGRAIILVDDVLTSGATSEACVRALKKAGAASVTIACFARVLDEALDAQTETPGA